MYICVCVCVGPGGAHTPPSGLGALTHLVALRVLRYTLNPEP